MHRRTFCISILFAILFALPAIGATKAADKDQNALLEKLTTLREVWIRKITLDYLADKRSAGFLKKLLEDFSPDLKNNFVTNITGSYKKEFIANYSSKADELTDQALSLMKGKATLDPLLIAVLKKSPFPIDRGFAPLVKKLGQTRTFQATQNASKPKTQEAYKKLSDFWKALAAEMKETAKKDAYPAVQAMYAKTAVKDFPIHWFDDAQHATSFETEGGKPKPPKPVNRKKWTVLAYICADNDLERYGLQDINEMEMVGSSDKVSIIAQVDRLKGGKGATITDGNWTGTRRYFVKKDNNFKKIGSKMVMNLGETDMGNKKTLADFLKWGVETYPADNFLVVIWNHGMGWEGIAVDEESGNYLKTTEVAWALREGRQTLTKINGKPSKFAIVDFDACLMGTIEVAYEIADSTEFMVASEETEPGNGMPYADYLEPLVRNPELTPREMTKRLVGTFVASYAKGGSATSSSNQGSAVTKSSVDLSKLDSLVKLFDKLGSSLLKNHEKYSDLLVSAQGQLSAMRRYSGNTLVDLVDLAQKFSQIPDAPADVKKICSDIVKTIGYPVPKDRLSKPVIINGEQEGMVIWGYNNWRMPPKELWPAGTKVFRSRLAITPLEKMGDKVFGCKIGPFAPVIDEALQKKVFVEEINFQLVSREGKLGEKRRIKQGKEYLVVSKFPESSPMVIEGHTQGMGDSRGLSIYYPPSYKFVTGYKALKFAKDTQWDEFLAKIPEFNRKTDILLIGQMVEDPMTIPFVAQALMENKVKFQVLWDPAVFGYQFKKILRKFAKDGVVMTDSVSQSSMGQTSPSSEDLIDYLDAGGSLLIAAQSFEHSNVHSDLLKNYFKFTYLDDEKEFEELTFVSLKGKATNFSLNGEDSAKTAGDVTIMKTDAPGKLFVTLADKRGAAIAVNGKGESEKSYSAVFLGFRFEAVSGKESRVALMSEILNRLYPKRHQMTLFD